ncbi:MAG TPA: YihY/virulence factor BrkB family protein [Solirubrobacter sp.]|nr:YihY/virulence factor BrkB family protein [Solirubrobacter sp.]
MSRLIAALDGWQRRHAIAGFPIAVIKKFTEDRGSNLAALIAFYGFFSLFPLLLAFVSILGFVLEGDPSLRQEIIDSAVSRIPVIGDQIEDQIQPLTGSGPALVIGLLGALWAGLGVTLALARAFAVIWDVPRVEQPNGIKARLRGLATLVVLAIVLIAATVVSGLAIGGGIGPGAQRLGAVALALIVNFAVFLLGFTILAGRRQPIREFIPGVVLASVGALALQSLGGWYVDYAITGATATYGVFALVIGLLSWFLLLAHIVLIAAEVNVVLARRLWPRSLTGELEPADRRVFERSAAAARRDRRAQIEVSFDDER